MVFKARFLSLGFWFLFPLTQTQVIYVNMCQSAFFLESISQIQGWWGCSSVINTCIVILLWKWGAGLLGGLNKARLGTEAVGERQHGDVSQTFIKDNSKVCCLCGPEPLDQLHLLEEEPENGPYHQVPSWTWPKGQGLTNSWFELWWIKLLPSPDVLLE